MVQRSRHIKGFSTRRHKKNTSIKRIETGSIQEPSANPNGHKKNTSIEAISKFGSHTK
jgi:hypothetical protein